MQSITPSDCYDCFIAAQLPKGARLVSYDEDFKKVEEVQSQTPEEILKRLR